MALITTHAACWWLDGLRCFCLVRKFCLYIWELLSGGRSPLHPNQNTWSENTAGTRVSHLLNRRHKPKWISVMHGGQVNPWAQTLCTSDNKCGLTAQNSVEVQSAWNAFLPITQLENRFPNLLCDTFLTFFFLFLPHPSCEKLIKLLKLCASLSSSVSWEQ